MVNGKPVLTGESVILHNNAVVEFSSLRFSNVLPDPGLLTSRVLPDPSQT